MRFINIIKMGFRNMVLLLCILGYIMASSCNKLVQIPNPISSVTAPQVFSSDATATSAILGIYSDMSIKPTFVNYQTTYYAGLSADELTNTSSGGQFENVFLTNTLTSLNTTDPLTYFWQPAYFYIYCANAIIQGSQTSTAMSAGVKNELTGEAKFVRAFCYFYLTNFFGDLPLVLTTDFNQTVLLAKSPQSKIYQQIISDLLDAQDLMIDDFSLSGGQPIRANKWAATALLARVYLYLPQPNYAGADSAATAVINSGLFSLVSLDSVFVANNKESILQLQTNSSTYPYTTREGNRFIPSSNSAPNNWLTPQLLGAFESNDMRRVNWVDSINYNGTQYYYPYKYQIRVGNSGSPSLENYILLRCAEQYLIRSEAEVNLGQLSNALNDLNTIRTRAGLDSLNSNLTSAQILAAVQQENRVEFFAEWGHRWFDLKRWGIAIDTLSKIPYKLGNINTTQLLYPLPLTEIQTDPNLVQNPGY